MKVKELITKLKKCDQNLEVKLHYTEYWSNDSGTSFDDDKNAEVNGVGYNSETVFISTDGYPAEEYHPYSTKKREAIVVV